VTSSAPPIKTSGLSKTYKLGMFMNRHVHALRALDMEIGEGQVFGLLGPNGAGKSTAIKLIMNLVRPSSGSAQLFGSAPSSPRARRAVGFLPENPAPYEYLTGREFVTLAGRLAGMSGNELHARVKEVLGSVQLDRAADLQIRRYSKGMIQRAALAQALVHRPRLLILDEPTSGLDPVGRRQIRDLVLEERDRGTTILFCTHIIPDVEALCDRVAVLVGGRLVREGTVRDLLTASMPVMELTVEGVSREWVEQMGVPLQDVKVLEHRLLLRCADGDVQPLIRGLLDAGGRLTSLHAARFSLEDLFLKALEEAGHGQVGGEIS
jgi:ABC-2 type transport system ATP-binding protein